MASLRRDLHGLADLKAALIGLGTEVATKTGVAANRRAAKRLLDRLVAVAPQGKKQSPSSKRYGSLRTNLRMRRVKGRTQGRIKHQVSTGNAFWALMYEQGTSRQAARPWMQPAVESISGELVEIQIEELRTGIERAARRLAKRSKG